MAFKDEYRETLQRVIRFARQQERTAEHIAFQDIIEIVDEADSVLNAISPALRLSVCDPEDPDECNTYQKNFDGYKCVKVRLFSGTPVGLYDQYMVLKNGSYPVLVLVPSAGRYEPLMDRTQIEKYMISSLLLHPSSPLIQLIAENAE